MRNLFQLSIALMLLTLVSFAQTVETYDIATYQPPPGWTKRPGPHGIAYSTDKDAAYCLAILYKSVPAAGNARENFDAAWSTLVKELVTVSTPPQVSPAPDKDGWQIVAGFAPFEKEGAKGVALLYTASAHNTMVNVVVLTNTDEYESAVSTFLESITLRKPERSAPAPSTVVPPENSIVGTWGQNLGAHMTYGDPVAAGMAGYSKDQYTFNADGTYKFVSKTFRMGYDKIILVIENGTYQINGDALSIRPQKSTVQAWSKLNGGDGWGRLLSTQARKLEAVTYKFKKHYFSGINEWNLVLQADQPTERDGPFSTFKLFPNAWYYKPISSNNPIVQLPK